MTEAISVEEHLKELEERLLEPEIRKSAAEAGALLADNFQEFTSTGQIYDKAEIIAVLRNAPRTRCSLTDFKAVILAPDVALATFCYFRESTHDRTAAKSLRSSVWKQTNGRWQMVFHQGTLCNEK